MSRTLLFEIGTEELPANYIGQMLVDIKNIAKNKLNGNRLGFKKISTYGTPRRIALIIEGIEEKQADLDEVVKGPSKQMFYNEEGELSKAAIGFLRKNEVDKSCVYIDKVGDVDYIFVKKHANGQNTKEILKKILPNIITSIKTPKTMKWKEYDLRFARPIRWLVALFGEEAIEISIEGVTASKETRGHRTLSDKKIFINNAEEYIETMRKNYVLVDPDERKSIILNQIYELALSKGGNVVIDEELLTEVTFLVEYPTALIGNFEEEFLSLPKEAIITPMKEHQRYFPVENEGELLPYFIAVRNGGTEHLDIVKIGNQKVLRARLKDAQFFYLEDLKETLEGRVCKLTSIVYQEKLGTIYDKTIRVKELASYIAKNINLSEEMILKLKRAAYLCKADMMTNLVNEFNELQGVMGKYYALHDGEDKEVAEALRTYYLPRFSGDSLPTDIIGQILSISDKLDSIVGTFGIGATLYASNDPYVLRRQALGIIAIILDKNLGIDLEEVVDYSISLLQNKIEVDETTLRTTVISFIKQRLKVNLLEKNFRHDIIDSVLENGGSNLLDVVNRIKIISKLAKDRNDFIGLVNLANRVLNIINDIPTTEVNEQLFENESEYSLYRNIGSIDEKFYKSLEIGLYEDAITLLYTLINPVNEFLDNVMIYVEDEGIRENRLAMLWRVAERLERICDFRKIGI